MVFKNYSRNRLIEGNYPFHTIDSTYFKVRENDRVVSKALMAAYGTNDDFISLHLLLHIL
jgi:transposase-like protein